jgi:curved DNA-binding protein CbpA
MRTPFEILDISENATDDAIKKAYLKQIRKYSPEQAPEQFQIIRSAFESIKTQSQRLKYQLFHSEIPSIETLLEHIVQTNTPKHPTEAIFTETLLQTLHKKH